MSTGELACTYACLALHDDGIPITAEKIAALVKGAGVRVESYWPSLFAKLLEKKSIEELIVSAGPAAGGAAAPVAVSSSGSAPAAAPAPAPAEESKDADEESDDGMDFNIFD